MPALPCVKAQWRLASPRQRAGRPGFGDEPRGHFTLRAAGALFVLSAVFEMFSISSAIPLFGDVRGGLTAIAYHVLFVVVFALMGAGLWRSAPTYQYHFTRRSPQMPAWGAHHGMEISYVFDNLGKQAPIVDKELAAAMIGYWAQFARSGNPNGGGRPDWLPWSNERGAYLELGDRIQPGYDLGKRRGDQLDLIIANAWSSDRISSE